MSKTILIDENETTRSAYTLNLSTYVGTEVIGRKGPRDTIDLLEILSDFDLIITKKTVRGKNSPQMIQDYLKSKNIVIPIIILGDNESEEQESQNIHYLPPPIQIKELIELSSRVLGVVLKDVIEKKIVSEYIPVPINYFLLMKDTPCAVFIKINDSEGPKYIKRIHKDDEVSRTVLLKYQDSGVKDLYIHSDDRFSFTDNFTEKIIDKLDDENLGIVERVKVNEDALDFVHGQLRELGFNENVVAVSNSAMNSMMRSVKSTPKLADMLTMLQKNANGYMYKHTIMLNLVSCSIIQKINWATYEFLEKMSYISFFHDISLADPEWAKIHTIEDFNLLEEELTSQQRRNIMEHAMRSAEMLDKEPTIPMGVSQVIKQHHGVLNGIGFTSSFTHNMTPLSVVFIIAEHFVDSILNRGIKEFDKQAIKDFYAGSGKIPSTFDKTLDAFERAFE